MKMRIGLVRFGKTAPGVTNEFVSDSLLVFEWACSNTIPLIRKLIPQAGKIQIRLLNDVISASFIY